MIAEASETIKSKQQRKINKGEGKQSCPVHKIVLKMKLTPIFNNFFSTRAFFDKVLGLFGQHSEGDRGLCIFLAATDYC